MQVFGLTKLTFPQLYNQCKSVNNRNTISKVTPHFMNAQSLRCISNFCEAVYQKSIFSKCLKFRPPNSGKKMHIHCKNILAQMILFKVPSILKKHSVSIVKTCSEQCEFVLAHRLLRGYQIFNMYSKLWGEVRLWLLLNRIKQQFTKRGKEIIFSACVIEFNWDKERISDEELNRHSNDFERIYKLKDVNSSPLCSQFWQFHENQNSVIDKKKENQRNINNPCDCPRCRNSSDEGWIEFYRGDSFVAWKKEEVNHVGQGLYCYKIYGCFSDISAEDYFRVHCDTEFRKEWDKTAVQLEVIDTDTESNSDIIYWELLWPRMFSNRDYVFNRRFKIDNKRKLITVVNESTVHPSRPEIEGKHRVKEYWSYMVIKPRSEFHEPGLEFGITYFDNPELRIPYAVSSWVTYSGLSDYIKQQHDAALLLANRHQNKSIENGGKRDKFGNDISLTQLSKESNMNLAPLFPSELPAKKLCF